MGQSPSRREGELVIGYFDAVKNEKAALAVVPTVNNVINIRDTHDGLHPYAAAIRTAWLDRLDALPRPWFKGAAWDNNCFVTARKLIELANSGWAGYSHTDAHADYLAHAPHDGAWDAREKCWEQAASTAGATVLPEPAPNAPAPEVTVVDFQQAAADRAVKTGDEVDVAALVRERFPLLDFAHLMSTEDEGEEWIVEPLLPARRLVALYSAPKVGKSLLMLEIAVGIALGLNVLGVATEQRRVLYVDFENDPRGDVKRRLESMGYGADDGARLNDGLCYMSFPTLAKLDTAQGGYELLSAAQEYGCDVVVIDTVSRAVGGEENDNDTWLAFYRDTGMRLKGAGIACIRLDHSGKDAEKGMRGGSAKYGDVDAVWRLSAESETVLNLVCTDHRMPLEEDRLTLVRDTSPVLRHRVVSDRSVALDAKEKELDEALTHLGIEFGESVRTAKKKLRDHGVTFKNPVLERVLRARRLRLPEDLQRRPNGASPAPSGDASPTGSAPLPPQVSLKGDLRGTTPVPRGTPGDGNETGPSIDDLDPDTLVSCLTCHRPTTAGVYRLNAGLCATCHRDTGAVPEENP